MKGQVSNAMRFINAYNQIEQSLKAQNNLKSSLSYTETIRISARTNSIVRKYEDDLIDYGRLRNSIVHSANDNHVIAEPHTEVVEKYEKIMNLVCTPPLAINTTCVKKDVKIINAKTSLKDAMVAMYKTGFSNFPIYNDKGMLIGVANAGKVARIMGNKLYNKENFEEVFNTPIGDIVKVNVQDNFYAIADSKITLDKVLNLFAENRKLLLIIITPNGTLVEETIGIITVSDILDINKILDNYQ